MTFNIYNSIFVTFTLADGYWDSVPGEEAINGSKLGNEFHRSVKC